MNLNEVMVLSLMFVKQRVLKILIIKRVINLLTCAYRLAPCFLKGTYVWNKYIDHWTLCANRHILYMVNLYCGSSIITTNFLSILRVPNLVKRTKKCLHLLMYIFHFHISFDHITFIISFQLLGLYYEHYLELHTLHTYTVVWP